MSASSPTAGCFCSGLTGGGVTCGLWDWLGAEEITVVPEGGIDLTAAGGGDMAGGGCVSMPKGGAIVAPKAIGEDERLERFDGGEMMAGGVERPESSSGFRGNVGGRVGCSMFSSTLPTLP